MPREILKRYQHMRSASYPDTLMLMVLCWMADNGRTGLGIGCSARNALAGTGLDDWLGQGWMTGWAQAVSIKRMSGEAPEKPRGAD